VGTVKRNTSYIYAIFGMTLVLIVLGLGAVLLVEAQKIKRDVREKFAVELVLSDTLTADATTQLRQRILQLGFVKGVDYTSKVKAAEILQKEMGTDFMDVLGYNPLYAKFDVYIKEAYASQRQFEKLQPQLRSMPGVMEVSVQMSLIAAVDNILARTSMVAMVIGAILLVFAVLLIFNTIRLSIFSNRDMIKSMMLVGATKWFIARPFIGRALLNGFISTVIAGTLLFAGIFYVNDLLPELGLQDDLISFAIVFAAMLLFAELVSALSTVFALLRYLRYKPDELY